MSMLSINLRVAVTAVDTTKWGFMTSSKKTEVLAVGRGAKAQALKLSPMSQEIPWK